MRTPNARFLPARFSVAALLALALCACHRDDLVLDEDDDGGPTSIVVSRFELTGSFEEVAAAAEAAITGQGGPSGVRSQDQLRFRNRAGRLTLRKAEDGSLRVELVVRLDASAGDQYRWQQYYRAMGRLRGLGRRIVNGQPVE